MFVESKFTEIRNENGSAEFESESELPEVSFLSFLKIFEALKRKKKTNFETNQNKLF